MQNSKYTVLITASGSGSRMGNLTKYTNKTLISLGRKPVISHIIETYPKSTHFVITLGHFGKQVKDFLSLCYPKHNFTFLEVDKYEGEGSSLGYSMLKASKLLQKPFIYHASDTIVEEKVPLPEINWIGGYKGEGSSNYASFNLLNGEIQTILDKGIPNPDYLHIGLVGIYDYKLFWKLLRKLIKENKFRDALGDIHVLNSMIAYGINFKVHEFTRWYDSGNTEALLQARKIYSNGFQNLDKPKEAIFLFNNFVIKFYSDPQIVQERVKRAQTLKTVVPRILSAKDNFFTYKYIDGELYADVANPRNFTEFLRWSHEQLWKPVREVPDNEFKRICYDFYYRKTKQRVREFLSARNISDTDTTINGEKVPPVEEILKLVDFKWIADTAEQTTFHGDYILDNIIKTDRGFYLLDWRNNFGGLLKAGDMYYDLAKLNHNLIINHAIVHKNLFTIRIDKKNIICDILRKESLIQCQALLHEYIKEHEFDLEKIKMMTPLIWINSAPLHHYPYDHFLFYFGKYNLWKALNNKNRNG